MIERKDDGPASGEAWLRATLDEILERVRRLLAVDACAFEVVDWERGQIHAVASWFADERTRALLAPVLTRPYEPARAGVTEAAIERGEPLLISAIDAWEGAGVLRERLFERLPEDDARDAWAWY